MKLHIVIFFLIISAVISYSCDKNSGKEKLKKKKFEISGHENIIYSSLLGNLNNVVPVNSVCVPRFLQRGSKVKKKIACCHIFTSVKTLFKS